MARRNRPNFTPVTSKGLQTYDKQNPAEAAVLAWKIPGRNRELHTKAQSELRRSMPLVAKALDTAAYGKPLSDERYGIQG